jgi:ribosomal protein S18 acetylase RimI-like enzyme
LANQVTVARATWRDTLALWRLERACFPGEAYDPLTLFMLVAWRGNVALKAMNGATLAGFVAGDEPWGKQVAWIVTLGVEPAHQRQGIGARLLAECEARLTRPVVRLMVRAGNAPAIALYKKFGYVQVRAEAGYYGDGETGWLMEKNRGA